MEGFDWGVIQRSLPYLFLEGMRFTVTLTVLSMAGGIIFGTLLAMMRLSSFIYSALVTFTMFEAAYYCEIMRAGIQSIPRGQVWSGYALGLNYWQAMGYVVLPQAFRNMVPILLTQTIILFQDTSLVYVISATDFLGAAAKIANRDYRLVEMYTFVAVVYFIISFGLSYLVKNLQAKIAVIR